MRVSIEEDDCSGVMIRVFLVIVSVVYNGFVCWFMRGLIYRICINIGDFSAGFILLPKFSLKMLVGV